VGRFTETWQGTPRESKAEAKADLRERLDGYPLDNGMRAAIGAED
jgi:hypothetical protein